MNAIVQTINAAGRAFVGAAVPMLIQSSLLILILLGVDALLRKRVRAVFRYWIWMLVLVKLVLPPSLWSPVSLGTWFGEKLEVPTTALLEAPELPPIEPSPAELSPAVTSILSQPPRMFVDPPRPEPMVPQAPAPAETVAQPAPIDRLPALGFLSWQGLALLVWAATVAALLLLLVQRTFFVRGLVAQGQEAGGVLVRELDRCRQRLGLRRPIAVRLSPNAASPAVCGLWRPVILVPQNLAARLRGTDLDAVLFHELAHVRRGDLWINLAQTILQILYFYNPLLWLANALIRRIREQAVDETVLVALGESAPQYPDTLIHVAKLALARRPALSLRLIGVVESKSALTSRIKHILNRPLPKTAKLGLLGLLAIIVIAVVLLPMAKGDGFGRQGSNVLIRFMPEDDGLSRTIGDMRRYARNYTVSFKRGETLAIVAELYQTGQPMRVLGCRTFTDPGRPERLSATLTMRDLNNERTAIEHSLEITLGKESLRATGVRVNTPEFFNNWDGGFLPVSEIAEKRRDGQTYVEFTELLSLRVCPNGGQPPAPRIWMPGHNVSWGDSDAYFVLVKMLPLSQLDILQVDRPLSGVRLPDGSPLRTQLPDGTYLPDNASKEQGEAVVEEYLLNLKRLMMQERMPLPKLMTHRYHKEGDPIWVTLSYPNGRTWKPDLEELVRRAIRETTGTFIFLVDGEEYESSWLCGPFAGGGEGRGELPEYLKRSTGFHLRPGKHTVAYGWKDLNVVDPNDPNHPVHFTRLATDPVEFEVVEELPVDYYRPVYQDGWEDILRRSIETHFTDDWHKHGVFGRLLSLRVNKLPFDTAFAVYVQAEGQEEQYPAGEMALSAGSYPRVVACDHGVKELNWDTAGDKRWRIILRPSIQVAKKYPPIREFYAREFVTDWLTFERSPEFELNRLIEMSQRGGPHRYGDTIRADKPVDLDRLPRRRGKRGPAWPLPAGFELGWSPDHGGTLRIDPNSGVRLLWLPEADARLVNVTAESRRRLVELPQSRTTEITPPQGERTLAAVLSSEGKVYFVTVSKVNEAWANLDWFEDQEATKQLAGGEPAAATTAPPAGAPSVQPARDASLDSDGDGLSDYDEIHKYLTDPAKKDSDGDGIPDGDWNERREYTYSVRTVLRYMPPFHEEGLNDDFQDGRVLKQTNEYIEIEVIHYPFATGQESIPESRNWRQDDTQMTEYLAPGPATNWDEAMRRDLLAALKADGIDVEALSDKQVVERVPRWLLDRSRYLDQAFTTWFVYFPQGKPTVYPGLEEAFRRDFERDSRNYSWTLDQHLDHEVLGKGMYYNKTHGSCTSTAVYLTTVLRALGIPTRMVMAAPCVDASDRSQILMVKNAITHNRVRLTMLAALNRASGSTTNHVFNEVYLGHRWCRLDYSQLGCSNFGLHRFGLQTHVYTFNDLSDANLAPTWGRRYAKGEHNDVFRRSNPYTAVEVSELFGPHGQVPNPPCTAQELDPHAKPDLFVLSPAGVDAWKDVWGVLESATFNKTSRLHERESYENLVEGMWLVRPQDFVVLLLALDKPERVPEGYEDLLPKPWPDIESQLRQGQTVELRGKARGMNVMVLSAPTADGLKPLVQNSKLLRAIGGSSPRPAPSPSAGATQTRVLPQSAAEPVRLAHDVTIELLGVCEHPSEGKQWWRPDGSPRETAPYQTGAGRMPHEDGYEEYEFALQVTAPAGTSLLWKVPGGNRQSSTNQPSVEEGGYLRTIYSDIVNQRAGTETASVSVGIAGGPWQTVARHEALDHEGVYTVAGDKAISLGVPYEKDGMTHVPTTTNLPYDQMESRVVALDKEGNLHTGDGYSSIGGNILISGTTRLHVPLNQVKALLVQTRPWTWVTYKDVSLRPGRLTHVTIELQGSNRAAPASRRPSGQGNILAIGPTWEILRGMLDERFRGSIGGFSKDPTQTKRYFDQSLSWMAPGDTFLLMFAFDKPVGMPPEDADLLPLPWAEIEKRVRSGQTVEAQGEARGLTVIVLAAPTTEQLNTVVRQTHLLDPFRRQAEPGPAAVRPSQSRRPPGQERVVGIGPVCGVFEKVLGKRYGGSIGGFSTDPTRTKQYFDELLSWIGPGDVLVLMLALDQSVGMPPEYADLLPWSEIQNRVRRGQTVEAQGQARALTVIVLAAPTSGELEALIRQTHLLDPFRPEASKAAAGPSAEQETEIVLPEADRQHVILDLATGELVPLPPAGPEPQKVQQALRKLGKGDLVYDCDLGDRTLILLRDATSEQVQEDTGEPSVKGHLIGQRLPEVLTVTTAEGRSYRITILAADDKACTLKYFPVSTDKGAGGGALAAPSKDVEILAFRIAPKVEEVGSELVGKYTQALTEGGSLPGGDFAWFEVRPGTTGASYQVTCEHDGKTYVLLWNDRSHVMRADGTWGVEEVRQTTDNMGVPWVILTFDAKGVQLLHALGDANLRHGMAVVFEGRVIAIPFITTTLSGTGCPISGRFTPEEIQQMSAALKTRMPAPRQTQDTLKRRMEEVRPGRVVLMPNGRHTTPVQVTEPMVLRGESAEGCIIEVTADQPAVLVNTKGQGAVILENLTIRWQLAGKEKAELPAALLVKGTNVVIRNCRFAPLGDSQRSPMAVYVDKPSKSTVEDCRFSGFDYVVCYGAGTEGIVQDCVITDCGHQGVIGYDGSTLTVQRNIITGSKFHAVRGTGGTLTVKDNLLVKNANRGIYLGNKTGQGTITNNLILGNGSGISGFGRANFVIANNVVADNNFSGIDMRDSCRFSIRNNVLARNQRGLALFKEGTENFNVIDKNAFWANATDVETLEKPSGSLTADPQFADPNHGDFTTRGPVHEQDYGLSNPQILKDLWQRYQQLQTPSGEPNQPQAPVRDAIPAAPQKLSGGVLDSTGKPVAGAQVALITEDKGVLVQAGRLLALPKEANRGSEIVETDAQGRFLFPQAPDEFHVVAAHDQGFAWVTQEQFQAGSDLRLEAWGRVEGTLRIGREAGANRHVRLDNPNQFVPANNIRYDYETRTDAGGRFLFEKVPPGWSAAGYLIQTNRFDGTTSITPLHLLPGQNVQITLGGEGRPVIGRFVPPASYQRPVYFGTCNSFLDTWYPAPPRPAGYDQMTNRERQAWYHLWNKTPEAKTFYDAHLHDLRRRHYGFRIAEDGSFRIEDVVPGKYSLQTELLGSYPRGGPQSKIGAYRGTIEVPPTTGAYTDQPLDLGAVTLDMFGVGEMAALFEAKTLDGKDIRLIDYRGKFVLLSFGQPPSYRDLARLKELHQTCGGRSDFQIIGFLPDWDTLETARGYVAKQQIEWPEIYLDAERIARQYGLSGGSCIVFVGPDGKIIATWLTGEGLMNTVREALKIAPASSSVPNAAANTSLAWQRTDRYVPPDPNGFFPDDPEGGKKLDALYQAVDKDQRSDEEILSTVRQGFRRASRYRADILGWIGNRYIWNKDPQNPLAVEIMYHAVPLEQYNAVYYGLSVLRHKPPNVLRTLADICMRSRSDEVGRITWGLGPQREELLPYLTPYLQDPDAAQRERAAVLVRSFKGELDFEKWQRDKRQEQAKAQFAGRLPQFNQTLLTGDSNARYRALIGLRREGGSVVLDDSALPAMQAAATDPDRRVRIEVAQLAGNRWVWAAQKQDPNAIALMVKLGADSDREVRYNAVYYGLSVVREKGEPVVRRLVELALTDHENSLYGRIVWGLRGFSKDTSETIAKVLTEHLGRAKTNAHHAASIYGLYRDVLKKEPPEDWGLAQVRRRYPEDLFVLPFSAREPFQPESTDALWSEFARALPEKIAADRLPTWDTNKKDICYARIRGKEQATTIRDIIANHPRLRAGEVRPLPLATQLYLEERYGVGTVTPQENR